MLVANRDDIDDGSSIEELELGVGIVDVRVVDCLDKCLSCIGSLQAAWSVKQEDTGSVRVISLIEAACSQPRHWRCTWTCIWRLINGGGSNIEHVILHRVLNNDEVLTA